MKVKSAGVRRHGSVKARSALRQDREGRTTFSVTRAVDSNISHPVIHMYTRTEIYPGIFRCGVSFFSFLPSWKYCFDLRTCCQKRSIDDSFYEGNPTSTLNTEKKSREYKHLLTSLELFYYVSQLMYIGLQTDCERIVLRNVFVPPSYRRAPHLA